MIGTPIVSKSFLLLTQQLLQRNSVFLPYLDSFLSAVLSLPGFKLASLREPFGRSRCWALYDGFDAAGLQYRTLVHAWVTAGHKASRENEEHWDKHCTNSTENPQNTQHTN